MDDCLFNKNQNISNYFFAQLKHLDINNSYTLITTIKTVLQNKLYQIKFELSNHSDYKSVWVQQLHLLENVLFFARKREFLRCEGKFNVGR